MNSFVRKNYLELFLLVILGSLVMANFPLPEPQVIAEEDTQEIDLDPFFESIPESSLKGREPLKAGEINGSWSGRNVYIFPGNGSNLIEDDALMLKSVSGEKAYISKDIRQDRVNSVGLTARNGALLIDPLSRVLVEDCATSRIELEVKGESEEKTVTEEVDIRAENIEVDTSGMENIVSLKISKKPASMCGLPENEAAIIENVYLR